MKMNLKYGLPLLGTILGLCSLSAAFQPVSTAVGAQSFSAVRVKDALLADCDIPKAMGIWRMDPDGFTAAPGTQHPKHPERGGYSGFSSKELKSVMRFVVATLSMIQIWACL